jgi:Flp pilus assembly protein TadD
MQFEAIRQNWGFTWQKLMINRVFQAAALGILLTSCAACSRKPGARPAENGRPVAAHGRPAVTIPAERDRHEEKMLAEALKKKPDHVPVLLRMASLAMESGKKDEAAQFLREAVIKDPSNIPARLDLGKILFETGRIPESIQTTEEILKIQPDNPDALYNLGAIYGNLGQDNKAVELWGRLISSSPQSESGKRAQQMMAELRKPS